MLRRVKRQAPMVARSGIPAAQSHIAVRQLMQGQRQQNSRRPVEHELQETPGILLLLKPFKHSISHRRFFGQG